MVQIKIKNGSNHGLKKRDAVAFLFYSIISAYK